MNRKYFSKALLYDERKNIIISMLAQAFMFFMVILMFIADIHNFRIDNSTVRNTTVLASQIPYELIFFICIIMTLYSYKNKESKYSFLFTQPYSRDSILITRIVAHMVTYTVPIIIYGIVSSILIIANKSLFHASASHLIYTLVSRLLSLFVMLTLIVVAIHLLEMLFGKSTAAWLLPFPIAILAAMEARGIYEVTSTKIPFLKDAMHNIYDFCHDNFGFPSGDYLFKDFWAITSLIIILIIALVFYISIILHRKIQFENISGTFMFGFVEKIFRFIISMLIVACITVAICIFGAILWYVIHGLSTSSINSINLNLSNNMEQIVLLFLDIIWAAMTIGIYILIGKIKEKRRLA